MTLLFSYMGYRKHYLLIKKSINKDFPNYQKRYSFNLISKKYQVEFILADRVINLTILPDSEWHEFKKKSEKNISNFTSNRPECKICFNQMGYVVYCRQCSFEICLDCFKKLNNGLFSCPQCRYIPNTMTEEDIAKNQWMQFLSLWREYESGIIA